MYTVCMHRHSFRFCALCVVGLSPQRKEKQNVHRHTQKLSPGSNIVFEVVSEELDCNSADFEESCFERLGGLVCCWLKQSTGCCQKYALGSSVAITHSRSSNINIQNEESDGGGECSESYVCLAPVSARHQVSQTMQHHCFLSADGEA